MVKKHYYKRGLAVALSALLLAEPVSMMTSSFKVYAQETIVAETTTESEVKNVELSETNFPDSKFRNYLKETFDTDGDGWIDANSVTILNMNNLGIESLKGIELFEKLLCLDCPSNKITNLDISKNKELDMLMLDDNQLTSIDLSQNVKLWYLELSENDLMSLDVSKNKELISFFCMDNNLTSIDVSQNAKLYYLYCSENKLTNLDVSQNAELGQLYCDSNELTSLDVSHNTYLKELYCQNNHIASLDISNCQIGFWDFGENVCTVDSKDLKYDLSQLVGMDVSRVTPISGGTIDGTILTFDSEESSFVYEYNCGNGIVGRDISATFTLKQSKSDAENSTGISYINPFKDVADDAWYSKSVQYAVQNGFFTGTSEDTFTPNGQMTRGMLVTVLYRAAGRPSVTEGKSYPDVKSTAYYAKGVAWASSIGMATGYADGNFHPNDPVTREQVAKIIYQYAKYSGEDVTARTDITGYSDYSKISSWAVKYLEWTAAEGVLTGSSNKLKPKGNATRAEIASILRRYMESRPATETPGTEEPGTETPGTEEPSTEEPSTEAPSDGEVEELTYANIDLGEDYTNLTATITFVHSRTDCEEDGTMDAFVAEFNEMYPNITVETEAIENYEEEVLVQLADGTAGDVMFIPTIDNAELSTYFIPYGTIEEMENYVHFADEWELDDKCYGIGYMGVVQGIVYNKKVFEEAGITEIPKTPDEFIAALTEIKKNTDAVPLFTNYCSAWVMSGQWDYYLQATTTGDEKWFYQSFPYESDPFKDNGDGTGAYALYKILYDATAQGLIEEDYKTSWWEDGKEKLGNGEAGCMVLGSWSVSPIKETSDTPENVGYMPFPITVDGEQYASGVVDAGYGINANASEDTQKAAMVFVKWMVEESGWCESENGFSMSKTDETAFEFNDVNIMERISASTEEEALMNAMNEASELYFWDSKGDIRLLDLIVNAAGDNITITIVNVDGVVINEVVLGENKSYDEIMAEWTQKWNEAQESLGIETTE